MNLKDLKNPFPAEDIEWRIQQGGVKDNRPWGMVLAYVTNRAIMERLDDVCGPENWQNEFAPGPAGGVVCGISIKIGEEWIKKWDGADKTNIEEIKGGLSGSMKRAAVQWGVGRYLYNLAATWAIFDANGKYSAKLENKWFKWNPPDLPPWALPDGAPQKKRAQPKTDPPPHDSKPAPGASMTDKQSAFIVNIGMGLKDPYSPLSKAEVVKLVRWKAQQLGVDPKSKAVADAFLPRRDEKIKPWDKFATVFDEWMDWKQGQHGDDVPIFDEQGNEVCV